MKNPEKIESPVWYAVYGDYSFKAHDTPLSKLRNSYWIKQIDTGERHTTDYNNTYNIYRYEILDKHLKAASIELNGWSIMEIIDPKVKHAFHGTSAVYADPLREIRTETVHGIDTALSFLKEISKYENWDSYLLKKTNEDLAKELKSLQEDRDQLYSRVYYFENTLLFKKIRMSYNMLKDIKPGQSEILSFCKEFGVDEFFVDNWLRKLA